jgi:hypothetical protein
VIRVAGDAVWPEGEHDIGSLFGQHARDLLLERAGGKLRQQAIREAEPPCA